MQERVKTLVAVTTDKEHVNVVSVGHIDAGKYMADGCRANMQLHNSKAWGNCNLNVAEDKLADTVAESDGSIVIGLHGAFKFNSGKRVKVASE